MNAWKPIVAALVIFAAGVVTGGLTVNLRRFPGPVPPPARGLEPRMGLAQRWEGQIRDLAGRMERELNLTAEQRERIAAIVRDSQRRIKDVVDEITPRARDEMRQMRERIRQELTPEQRRQFESLPRMREDWRRRMDQPGSNAPPRQGV